MKRLGLLSLLAVWCGHFLCAQIDGTLYTDGKIVLQISGGFDHGTTSGETRTIYAGFNNEHHWHSCDPTLNESDAELHLFKGGNIVSSWDNLCTNVPFHNISWTVPALVPGNDYRFYFYYDERPTSSCCADFHSVFTDYFVIGEDISITNPANNSTQPIDLTFGWTTTANDEYYHFGIAAVDAGMSFSSSTETFNNALYSTTLAEPSFQLPAGILADGITYRVLVFAKQFGVFFSANADFTASSALPAIITYFESEEQTDGSVQLVWRVAEELNVLQYNLEVSEDGVRFDYLASIPAMQAGEYSFQDNYKIRKPASSMLYYRIKTIDADGSIAYSWIISVMLSPVLSDMHVFPNPVTDILSLRHNELEGIYEVNIYSADGRLAQQSIVLFNATEPIQLNVSSLPTGEYFLIIPKATELLSIPFVKQE